MLTRWLKHALFISIALTVATHACATLIIAEQARVIDGDTIEILSSGSSWRVRLQGIDAPERDQPFGTASSENLTSCLNGRTVVVQSDKIDRYDRLVGTVLADGNDCNLQQLRQGMAWHYKYYQNEQSAKARKSYAQAERHAQQARLGLWADCAVAPWDWRQGTRSCQPLPNTAAAITTSTISNTSHSPKPKIIIGPVTQPAAAQCQRLSRLSCKAFTSCQEAKQALACGNSRIDGDKDGKPCEQLCS